MSALAALLSSRGAHVWESSEDQAPPRLPRGVDVVLLESPLPAELRAIARNKLLGAQEGRKPGLMLERGGKPVALTDWGKEVVAACEPIAVEIDAVRGGAAYRDALGLAVNSMEKPESVPSARVLDAMARNHGNSHVRLTLAESLSHRGTLLGIPLKAEVEDRFARLAAESLEKQKKIEASDRVDFETYRERYLNPDLLRAEALVEK